MPASNQMSSTWRISATEAKIREVDREIAIANKDWAEKRERVNQIKKEIAEKTAELEITKAYAIALKEKNNKLQEEKDNIDFEICMSEREPEYSDIYAVD